MSAEAQEQGETLLTEFFDNAASPAKEAAKPLARLRKWVWEGFEKRFRSGPSPRGDTPLAPYAVYRRRATELNYHYSSQYRGAFLLNYALAIVAVVLAAASLALLGTAGHTPLGEQIATLLRAGGHIPEETAVGVAPSPWLLPLLLALAVVKLGIVVFISRNTRRANREKWNDRAVDYRYLAERLRGMYQTILVPR